MNILLGSIKNHQQVNEFLQSQRQTMIYSGVFNGINHAREFVYRYDGQSNGYSVKMTASGAGKRAQVEIVKIGQYSGNESVIMIKYQKHLIIDMHFPIAIIDIKND